MKTIKLLILVAFITGCSTLPGTNAKLSTGKLGSLSVGQTQMQEVKRKLGTPVRTSPVSDVNIWNRELVRMDKVLPVETKHMWIYEKRVVNMLGAVDILTAVLLFNENGTLIKLDSEEK